MWATKLETTIIPFQVINRLATILISNFFNLSLTTIYDYVMYLNEMVDLELLQQIRDLLINGMNGLDANELLHPADPHPDPVADPVD